MNEKEFAEFWKASEESDRSWPGIEWYDFARIVWLKSARRADRKAREECAEICERKAALIRQCNPLRSEPEWAAIMVDDCADRIRATITSENLT